MQIDRRTFVVGTGLVAAVASIPTLSILANATTEAPCATAAIESIEAFEFKVHGWDQCDRAEAQPRVWIGLNHQWRANWR